MRILAWPAFSTKRVNPYPYLLSSHVRDAGAEVDEFSVRQLLRARYDILHIHWPDYHVAQDNSIEVAGRVARFFAIVAVAKARGARIVWTAHNIRSHERLHPHLESILWFGFTRFLDGVISLSEAARELLVERFPRLVALPMAVIPHGHYRDVYPPPICRSQARRQLGLNEASGIIGFVGAIRPYKRVPELVDAFVEMRDASARLLIGGFRATDVPRASLTRDGVVLRDHFLTDAEIPVMLGAADLIVIPYSDILNSGSALLALTFGRPVMLPNRGAMSELEMLVGSDWVRLFEGPLTAETLRLGLSWARQTSRADQPDLGKLDWSQIACRTIEFYDQVLGQR